MSLKHKNERGEKEMIPEKDILKLLGLQIRFLREYNEMKQQDLAEKLNISQATLARYENGEIRPPIETLVRIADYFGVSVDSLLGRGNKNKDPLKILMELQKQREENELADEISEIIEKSPNPEELKLLLRQLSDCSPKVIRKIIQIAKAIEEEEQKNE